MSEEDKKILTITLRKDGDMYITQVFGQEYMFRKWTWGEKNALFSKCQRIGPSGEVQFNQAEFNISLLLATLKRAPFPLTRETIEKYPDSQLIDILIGITSKLNLLGNIEIQNL